MLLGAELRAHPGRTAIGILAIAIGVAMGYAVYLINHAALAEFSQAVRTLTGEADLQIRGARSGFDEQLYPRLARLPEVAGISPVVEAELTLPGHHETLKLLGVDVFRAMTVTPELVGRPADAQPAQLAHLDPAAVFLSPAALAWLKLAPGDSLEVLSRSGTTTLQVAGTLSIAGSRLAVMDIGAAQWRFGQAGRLQQIDLRLRPGTDIAAFQQRIATLLPPGVSSRTPRKSLQLASNLSRAYRVNLNVLALMALFTGAFLVFSGQALSIVARRTQLALLRALGMTRRQLRRLVLAECLMVGLAGSLLGIVAGAILAALALHFGGGDLGGGYFSGLQPRLQPSAPAAVVFVALGTLAAALGGLAPAREAARARPALALKAGDQNAAGAIPHIPWRALVLMIGGLALTLAGPVAGLPIPAYLAIGLLLISAVMSMPLLAHRLFDAAPRSRHVIVHLALTHLAAAPARVVIGLAGVLVSFSLMVSMAIMVHSFRTSFDQWLDIVLPAQIYARVTDAGAGGHFSDQDRQRMTDAPGVARVEFTQTDQLTLDPDLPPVALIIRPMDPRHPQDRLALVGAQIPPSASEAPPVWVSEAMVDLYGMRVGQAIRLPLAGQWRTFVVAGVWRDYARQYGAIVINARDAERLTGNPGMTEAALWLLPHASATQVLHDLRRGLGDADSVEFRTSGDIRRTSLRIFDRSFALTYGLEAVAILIGLAGVGVSFGAQAMARRREFGMLRHIGLTRAQIGRMLMLEGGLLGLLGVAAGLILGSLIAWILVAIVNPQSFHWTMSLHMPWGQLATAGLALIAAACVTALASAKRAMSASAVRAVREDW